MKIRYIYSLTMALFMVLSSPELTASNKASQGDMLPSFNLPDLASGEIVNSDTYKGKVLWVDTWASWCAPCRQSFPFYNELYAKLKDKGLVIIGINQDADIKKAKRFAKNFQAAFPLVWDPEDASGNRYANNLNIPTMPTAFLVDKSGKIVYVHSDFIEADAKEIERKITKLLE